MTARVDVCVVGAGVMGCATAWALARAGIRPLLLEQFDIGHRRGSSHGRSRIFRLSYPDDAYVSMAQQARGLWQEIETEAGETLLTRTGGVDGGPDIDRNAAALAARQVEHEVLDGAEAARRFPQMHFEPDERLLFQPDAGFVRADRAWHAFARAAETQGAQIRQGERVHALEPREGSVVVRAGETIEAGVVVVTAGPWAGGLLRTAGIDLPVRPTRETVAFFRVDGEVPAYVEWGEPSVYALVDPEFGLKVGEHIAGPTADPDSVGGVDAASLDRLRVWVARRFPRAESEPAGAETCFYTNTDDEHFVLRREGSLVIGSPCSGHGFKFAPLIGTMLADLVAS